MADWKYGSHVDPRQMKFSLLNPENGVKLSLGVSFSKNCGTIESIFVDDVEAIAAAAAALVAFFTVQFAIAFCTDVLPNPTPQCVNTTTYEIDNRRERKRVWVCANGSMNERLDFYLIVILCAPVGQ